MSKKTDVRKAQAALSIRRYEREEISFLGDRVVIEEPLEIYVNGDPYYMTMRLPGQEMELALGYCFGEGIIDSMHDVLLVRHCEEEAGNRVEITLEEKRLAEKGVSIKGRVLPAYSSCGICGKEMVADICNRIDRCGDSFRMPVSRIDDMIGEVEARQLVFLQTGGTHATGIFNKNYELIAFAEDVGRHNALDKATGELVAQGRIGEAMVVVATSRLSYEMVQKTARSGAQVLVGVSIATSLAIDLAERVNLTLIGFARKGRGNVYSGSQRVIAG